MSGVIAGIDALIPTSLSVIVVEVAVFVCLFVTGPD